MVPAELAITNAISEVEKLGASENLTEAVTKLMLAKDLVADHLEEDGLGVTMRSSLY